MNIFKIILNYLCIYFNRNTHKYYRLLKSAGYRVIGINSDSLSFDFRITAEKNDIRISVYYMKASPFFFELICFFNTNTFDTFNISAIWTYNERKHVQTYNIENQEYLVKIISNAQNYDQAAMLANQYALKSTLDKF